MAFLYTLLTSCSIYKGGSSPTNDKQTEINLTLTQILPIEDIVVTAYVSGVPIACLVTAEATIFICCPLFTFVALTINPHRITCAVKTLINLPIGLFVVTTNASKRRGLQGGRAWRRGLCGIGWRYTCGVADIPKTHSIPTATATVLISAFFPQRNAVILWSVW